MMKKTCSGENKMWCLYTLHYASRDFCPSCTFNYQWKSLVSVWQQPGWQALLISQYHPSRLLDSRTAHVRFCGKQLQPFLQTTAPLSHSQWSVPLWPQALRSEIVRDKHGFLFAFMDSNLPLFLWLHMKLLFPISRPADLEQFQVPHTMQRQ